MDRQYAALIATFFGGLFFQILFGFIDGIFLNALRERHEPSLLERIFDFINTIIFWTGSAVLLGVITGMKIYEYDILDDILGKFHILAAGIFGMIVAVIFWFILAFAYVYAENKSFERAKKRQKVFLAGHSK